MEFVQSYVHGVPNPASLPAPSTTGRSTPYLYWAEQSAELGFAGVPTYQTITITFQVAPADPVVTRRRLHGVFQSLTREPRRIPVTEARQSFSELLEWTSETGRPAVILNHGKPHAVVLSFDVFQRALRSLAREVLSLGTRRSHVKSRADDVLEAEMQAVSKRLRQNIAR